jgi:hypothetical protein
MKEANLGQLIDPDSKRDAIHVAIMPAFSPEELRPGQHVGINAEFPDELNVGTDAKVKIGIVDPFLRHPVQPGQRFYVCLYPKTVSSLRHAWTHPLIGEERP